MYNAGRYSQGVEIVGVGSWDRLMSVRLQLEILNGSVCCDSWASTYTGVCGCTEHPALQMAYQNHLYMGPDYCQSPGIILWTNGSIDHIMAMLHRVNK